VYEFKGKIIFILIVVIVITAFFGSAKASHSMGADLTYTCLSGNTYKLRLAFYRDCIGIAEPSNATITISSVSCGQSFDIVCTKIPGTGQEITPLCPSANSTCNGGIFTGIEEWIYEGTVVLPMQCTDWVFSFTYCCRNAAINTIVDPGNNDFHIYSMLNNTTGACNNSPTFSNKPVPFVCIGQQFCFNHGAYDADGDSLVYSLINPLQNATTPVSYFSPYSATQPVNSLPAMTFNSANGNICMTPQVLEVTVMAVLVQEYRNGVLIGSVERDIQVTVLNCNNNLPTLSGINGTSAITATICANSQYCFNLFSNDIDVGQNVTITYDQSIPGATFSSNGAQIPTGTFCWTPTTANINSTPYCFTVTVRDNACPYYGSQVYSFCLTVTGVVADAGLDQYLGCNTSTTITGNGAGGIPPYSYLWSTGSNAQSISVGVGTYTLTVSDGMCSMVDVINVTNAPLPTITATPVTNVSCNAGSDGSITTITSGGTPAIQYSINNGTTYQSGNVFSGLPAGTYSIMIRDANGCTSTASATITEPPPLVLNPTAVTATCTGSNGSITIVAAGGTGTINYSINNGNSYQPSNVFNGLATSNYNILVKDANGCTATSSTNVPDEPPPTITATPVVDVTCNSGSNGSITVNSNGGTGTIEYSIDNGTTYQTANVFSGLTAGTYSLMIRDVNGCTATAAATISEPSILVVNPSSVTATCTNSNGSITIIANGGTGIIQFSIDNGATYQSSNVFNGLSTGNYNIVVQDANGCTMNSTIVVPDEPSPTISSIPVVDVTCYGGSDGTFSVNTNGGTGLIEFSMDNGITYQAGNVFSGLPTGSYSVTIQDANGCTAISNTVISEPPPIVITPSSVTTTCTNSNGSIAIIAGGGTGTIEYSIDNGAAYQSSNVFNGLATGNYDIIVIDANGCTGTSAIVVPDQPSPTIAATPVTNVSCNAGNDGTITVIPNGGTGAIQYSIDNGATYQSGDLFTGLIAGNYSIIILDVNGCTATANAIITEPTQVFVNPTAFTSTCTNNNGSITLVAGGGTGTIEYSINNGAAYQSSNIFNGLATGNYDIMVIDANGCTATSAIVVPDQPAPTISATPVTNVSCFAGNDGTITIIPNGGTGAIQYSIDNGATYQPGDLFTGLIAGNYSIIIQDANGCTATTNAIITEPTPVFVNPTSFTSTCTNSNGSITLVAGGGTGTIQYSIDNGAAYQSSSIFNGLATGNYDIMVIDANGCTATSAIVVPDQPAPTISATPVTNVSCFAGNDGTITIIPNGGTGAIQYSIDNGATYQSNDMFTGLIAGNYSIIIKDVNGCTATANAIINEPTPVILNASSVDATCNGSNGSITASGIGGTGNIEFSIDGGINFQTSGIFIGLPAGNYNISASDANGCLTSILVSVNNALAPDIASVQHINVSCYAGTNGSITINAIGGTGVLEFSINNGTTFQSSNTFSNLAAGNYDIVVRDANGCLTTSSVILTQPSQLVLLTSTEPETCGNNNGSIAVIANGGTGTIVFSIDNGSNYQSASIFNGLNASNYTILVMDANGCTSSSASIVPDAPSPTIQSVAVIDVSCNAGNNGSITIYSVGGSGLIQYSIDSGMTFQNGNVFNNLQAGNYQISIQDTNGCVANSVTIINEPNAIVLITSSVDATCNGSNGTITMNGSGGTGLLLYSIDGGVNFQPQSIFSGLFAGNYTIIAQDVNGCIDSVVANVNNALAPVIASIPTINVTCNAGSNGSITINANGGTGVLLFSTDNGITFQNSNVFTNLSSGQYHVVVKDANGCVAGSVVNITEPQAITFSVIPVTETCSNGNGSITINAIGGTGVLQYSINGGTAFQSASFFDNLASANYNIVVQDANGCVQSGIVNVPNAASPTITAVNATNLTCFGSNNGSITIIANGGSGILQYSIDGGASYQFGNIFTNLSIGNFNIAVLDTNSCTVLSSVAIIQPPPVIINSTTTQSVCGNSNGSLTLNVNGGNGIFVYSIDSGMTFGNGNVFVGLAAANYFVVVHDGAGCLTTAVIPVSNALSPVINAVSSINASCFGLSDGSIAINANGGVGALLYSINNGVTYYSSNIFDSLPAGNYNIAVIDSNECIVTSNVILSEPPQIIVNTFSLEASCGNSDGSVTVLASGGTGTLQFSIDSSTTFQVGNVFQNLGAGNYNVFVQDSTGCKVLAIASVSNINGPIITGTIPTHLTCFASNDGSITINASGGIGNLSYSIDNGNSFQTTNSFLNLPGGVFSVLVTDVNNCIASDGVVINEPPQILFNTLITDVTCNNNNGLIEIYATGGTGTILYSIDSSQTFQASTIFNNLLPGNYLVTAQDANGCNTSANTLVNNLVAPSIASVSVSDVKCNGGNDGTAGISLAGGAAPFVFQWSNGGTAQNINGLITGNYSVVVTDADLCTATQSVLIVEPSILVSTTTTLAVSCFGNSDGAITAITSGGTIPYAYQWSSGGINANETNLLFGNYTVSIIDANGCSLTLSDSVTTPNELLVSAATTAVNCFGNNNGAVSSTVTGGTFPYSYLWSNGAITSNISGISGGNYTVTITDINNCLASFTAPVFEPPLLTLAVSGNTTICISQQASLFAFATGGTLPYYYLWNNGLTTNSQIVSPTITTSYTVSVTDANGCTVVPQPVVVAVNSPLVATTTDDVEICDGQNTVVGVTAVGGSGGPYIYHWSNYSGTGNSLLVSPSVTTTYVVTVSDNCGTPPVTDSVTVIIHPLPDVNFTLLPPSGCVPLQVSFEDGSVTINGSLYQWTFGDGSIDSIYQNPVHTYYEPGSYDVSLTVTTPFGCVNSLTKPDAVIVHSLPIADFSPDPRRTSILNPQINFTDYSWDAVDWRYDFGDGVGSSVEQNSRYIYQDTGIFKITLFVSNQFGCLDTSYETIIIDGDFTIYIPNVFTPNGDGINEFFFPQGIGIVALEMNIFDRWGQKVFASNSMEKKWDGNHMNSNEACAEDVYVYVIMATDLFAHGHEFTGRVSLVK
jgi:gliding motility-associated-like protein